MRPLKCISGYLSPITTQDFVLGQTAYQPADAVVDNGNVRTDDIPVPTGRKYSDFLKMPYAYRASSTTMKLLNMPKRPASLSLSTSLATAM